jgi:hypothetical protein
VCSLAIFSCLGDLLHDGVTSDKLRRTEHAVEAYRAQIDTHKAEKYGFASMAAVPYAHIVGQLLGKKRPKGTEISLAPNPKDIVSKIILAFGVLYPLRSIQIWENLNQSSAELVRKKTTGWFLLFMIAFLNTVPLFVLSILANLSSVCIITISYRIFPYCIPEDCQLCPIPPALVSVFPSFI